MDLHGFLGLHDPIGFFVCLIGFALQIWMARKRKSSLIASTLLAIFLFGTYLAMNEDILPVYRRSYPNIIRVWIPGLAMAWSLAMCFIWFALTLRSFIPAFNPKRRNLFRAGTAAIVATPFAIATFGILTRKHLTVKEVDIKVPSLPRDLQNLRLVQVSDIHLSPFYLEKDLAYVVDAANELRGDIAIVTGDLITSPGDPIDACLRQLSRLRSHSGIWGCLGNHERFAGVEDYATLQGARLGINFLRSQATQLQFGAHSLNLAGVDYQSVRNPYLEGAEELVNVGQCNLLLSHNPDVFQTAASKGFDVVLAGHTHGGQINVEIFDRNLNVADFVTPIYQGFVY